MSMRTALMEMAKPKTERAAWVPESILDDDVSHFMGAAAAAKKAGKSHFNFGGKKYKVTMKHDTAKKVDESASCDECGLDGECQCEQPVQEAKVDEVSYKTAMKSYQKAMGQSKDADTAGDKKTGDKKFDQAVKFGRYATKKFKSSRNKKKLVGTFTGKESVEEALDAKDTDTVKAVVKALKGASKAHAGQAKQLKKDLQDAADTEMDPKDHVKYNDEMGMYCVYNKSGKVVAKFKDQKQANDYAMKNHDDLMEALAPGATAQHSATKETSDTYDKQMSNGENDIPMGKKKDFVNQHKMEVAYDAEELYKQNKYEALSKTPARPGDKSDGDKNVVNPIPTNMVDGMRAALAKMKNSGE